jgi:hypothetical protein
MQTSPGGFTPEDDFTLEELEREHAAELPGRDLLLTISVLGIPIASIDGLNITLS